MPRPYQLDRIGSQSAIKDDDATSDTPSAFGVTLACLTLAAPALAAPGDLVTIAGGPGGGLASGLGLVPSGLAVDSGDLIVSDQQNGAIRSVALSTGGITALAGTGSAGSGTANVTTGRAGSLTQLPGYAASVAGPLAVSVALDGDVVFSVGSGGTLRRLDRTTGVVTRIAGPGTSPSRVTEASSCSRATR